QSPALIVQGREDDLRGTLADRADGQLGRLARILDRLREDGRRLDRARGHNEACEHHVAHRPAARRPGPPFLHWSYAHSTRESPLSNPARTTSSTSARRRAIQAVGVRPARSAAAGAWSAATGLFSAVWATPVLAGVTPVLVAAGEACGPWSA